VIGTIKLIEIGTLIEKGNAWFTSENEIITTLAALRMIRNDQLSARLEDDF